MASDLGLYYLSMSHKKNARLIWVKYFCCMCYSHQLYCFFIELDNDWIKSRFNHMNRLGVRQRGWGGEETVTIKTVFAMARINVYFNVSFLNFNQYCK